MIFRNGKKLFYVPGCEESQRYLEMLYFDPDRDLHNPPVHDLEQKYLQEHSKKCEDCRLANSAIHALLAD